MSITSSQFENLSGETRIRQGSEFVQIPNLVPAGEQLTAGQFVRMQDGAFYKSMQPTHLVLKSGEPRITPFEVSSITGNIVLEGEPTLAVTAGPGVVTIPFQTTVYTGDLLTVSVDGYAVKKTGAGYVIGTAMEDMIVTGNNLEWGNAMITLPAAYNAS